jgi:hypothetical protein
MITKKCKYKGMQNRNKGVTMVELIVTFALLAIFLAASTMCISHAIIFFFDEQQRMRSYTVADVVLSELKKDIRTMQASDNGRAGYVKLRNGSGAADVNGGIYTGTTIEFIASNINDGQNAVQIDTAGCNADMIDGKDEKLREVTIKGTTTTKATLPSNYLSMRYYGKMKETNSEYANLFMDKFVPGTYAAGLTSFSSLTSGCEVVWHAQEKLPKEMYQDYIIDLEFSVKPRDDGSGNNVVDYVDVTVFVKKIIDESVGASETVYEKTRRIDIQNEVYYKLEPTMYSDK